MIVELNDRDAYLVRQALMSHMADAVRAKEASEDEEDKCEMDRLLSRLVHIDNLFSGGKP